MKEYLKRIALVIHWIGFVLSIYFLIELLAMPSRSYMGSSFILHWYDVQHLYLSTFSCLPLAIAIRYVITDKIYLFPFNKNPLEKPINKGKALLVLVPFCLLLIYLINTLL